MISSTVKKDIQSAIESDSVWVPRIFVDIPPPMVLKNASREADDVSVHSSEDTTQSLQSSPNIDYSTSYTYIVPYLAPPNEERLSILKKLNLPAECVYRFDPFKGLHNKDKLRNYLITQSTLSSATDLTKGNTKRPVSGQFLDSVRLQCVCYRATRSKPRVFKDGKNQQPGLIKQQEHTSSQQYFSIH